MPPAAGPPKKAANEKTRCRCIGLRNRAQRAIQRATGRWGMNWTRRWTDRSRFSEPPVPMVSAGVSLGNITQRLRLKINKENRAGPLIDCAGSGSLVDL